MKDAFLLFLMSLHVKGVLLHEETQEQKTADVTLSVMEGESPTLKSGIREIQRDNLTVWTFGDTRIALMNKEPGKISLFAGDDEMFRNKLHLNAQTGYLTITNITTEHTGLYQLEIISSGVLSKRFTVTVNAYLPVPIVTKVSTQNSSSISKCVLLCSVMNVTRVSLSWYKGKSFLSNISVSDLNIRLSLPLEVEYQDTDTYRCVLTNSSSNQTQRLNITDICQPCSVKQSGVSEQQDQISHLTIVICVFVVGALLFVAAVVIFCIYRKFGKTDQHDQSFGEEHIRLNGVCGVNETKTTTDGVKHVTVKAGESFELDTGVKDIQTCDLIQWKFGEVGDSTNPFILISRIDENKEELLQKDRLELNKKTGSITVENSRTTDAGVYKLEIKSSTDYITKSFFLTVNE